MSETIVLAAEVREQVGTKHAARLRREGKLPGVVYGHKQDTVPIVLDAHDFVEGLHHGHRLFEVKVGRKKETLLVKDLQYDHLGEKVIHVDLVRVDLTEMVTVSVPIEMRGSAKGAHEGGIIDEHLSELEVECKVSDIPDVIPVFVKELGVGESLHAREIELPEGVKLTTDPGAIVLTCHLVAAAKTTEEVEEEMPVGPEVITEKAEETEGEEGEKTE